MAADVVVTGFGVRTAFGAGAAALRHGVFGGRPAFAPTSRFDTGPYRTPMAAAAPDGPSGTGSLKPQLVACGVEALDMAGLPAGEAAVLVGAAGDYTTVTHFWRGGDDVADGTVPYADAVPAVLAEAVAGGLGVYGPRFAFTNACVASSAAIIHACRLIASGRIEVAVCAGGYLVEEEVFAKFDSGRALARDGASLGEALSGLSATYTALGGAVPDFAAVQALALAWSEAMLEFLHDVSCEDPLTGLATQSHLRARLAEVYREGERVGRPVPDSHALLVVDAGTHRPRRGPAVPASPRSSPFALALRLAALADAVRTAFPGEETIARAGSGRVVVLVRRAPDLGATVTMLHDLMADLELAEGLRMWVEGLPDSVELGVRLLSELAR